MPRKRTLRFCLIACLLAWAFAGCAPQQEDGFTYTPPPAYTPEPTPTPPPIKDPEGGTILARFNPPAGYARVPAEEGSFGAFLRALPLKEDGAPVLLLDGEARDDAPQAAVIDLSIKKTAQQQGPRALVRLRAEYLYATGQSDLIVYHFLSGFTFPFAKWCEGYRVNVDGNKVEWDKKAEPSDDYNTLLSYLNTLFTYSNTRSLQLELQTVTAFQLGDVFLNAKSGAVMIVDLATNPDTGDTMFMLAHAPPSPTQEIFLLKNTRKPALSPWYSAADLYPLEIPPDGSFALGDLGRFNEELYEDG